MLKQLEAVTTKLNGRPDGSVPQEITVEAAGLSGGQWLWLPLVVR